MGTILMQDTFLSAVTEGRVDPAFHPSGVGKMGTVYSQENEVVNPLGSTGNPLGSNGDGQEACGLDPWGDASPLTPTILLLLHLLFLCNKQTRSYAL